MSAGGIYRQLWSLIRWIVLSGLVALIVAALFFLPRADDELRRFAETKLAEAYPHLNVRIGAAQRINGEGIRLRQISLMRPRTRSGGIFGSRSDENRQRQARSELAYVEQLTLRCDVSLARILQGDLDIRHIIINRMALHVERLPNGRFDLSELVPDNLPASSNGPLPQLSIEDSTLEIHDSRDGPARNLTADGIQLNCRFQKVDNSNANGSELAVRVDGSFRTAFCQRANISAAARSRSKSWTARGNLVGIDISHGTRDQLPRFLAEHLPDETRFANGKVDLDYELAQASPQDAINYKAEGTVTDATWQDPRLPQPLTNIRCRFVASPARVALRELKASYGEARLSGQLDRTPPAAAPLPASRPTRTEAASRRGVIRAKLDFSHFPITERLVQSLPEEMQVKWRKFKLLGHVSGTSDLRFDDHGFWHRSELDCHGISLEHYKFPYRIHDCHGKASYSTERLEFELQGVAGKTPLKLSGQLDHPGPGSTGWYEVETDAWKPIDDALVTALPDGVEAIVRKLQLRGDIGVRMRGEKPQPYVEQPPEIIVAISEGWVNYETFPYPISNIEGLIVAKNGTWRFEEFAGWNDGCRILCEGTWDGSSPQRPLDLTFNLYDVRMDEELRRALPMSAKLFWSQLRPRGQIDQATVKLHKNDDMEKADVEIALAQAPQRQHSHGDASLPNDLHLHPLFFPVTLSNVSGRANLSNNKLTLTSLAGSYGKTEFRTNGTGTILPDGGWQVSLTDCVVDRIRLDEPLLNALPPKLSHSLRSVRAKGTYSLAGAMHFLRRTRRTPMTTGWEMTVDVQQGSMNAGVQVDGIFGQCRLSGSIDDGGVLRTGGKLRIDSLVTNNLQFTDITGPIWIDSSRIVVGQSVPSIDDGSRSQVPLRGRLSDGYLLANAAVSLQDPSFPFSLQMRLTDANVGKLATERGMGRGNLSGQANLELELKGNARGHETFKGKGSAQLRNANLYELPLILALLNRLGTGRSDNTAFTNSEAKFIIRDGFFYFDQFDLTGDTITLKGEGEVGMDRSVSLNFYSLMGREQLWSPLVRPFIGEASRQFLLIHVDGTLDTPKTTQEVLPGLNETLRQLFPEQSALDASRRTPNPPTPNRTAPSATPEANRGWLRSPF